ELDTLAARQPPGSIEARHRHQDGGQAMLRLHGRRVAIGAELAAGLERRQRATAAVLADAVEHDVKTAGQNAREVLVLIVDRRAAQLATPRRMLGTRGAP